MISKTALQEKFDEPVKVFFLHFKQKYFITFWYEEANITDNDRCYYCNNHDTLIHYLRDCEFTKSIIMVIAEGPDVFKMNYYKIEKWAFILERIVYIVFRF